MKLLKGQLTAIEVHALSEYPNECVGVCVDKEYKELTNVADNPLDHFVVDPEEYENAIDGAKRICLIHSHPYDMNDTSDEAQLIRQLRLDRRQPSLSDMKTAQAMNIEFGIVCTEGETVSPILFFNGNDIAPYAERRFAHGVFDCWSLIVDWYKKEHKIDLPNTPREYECWFEQTDANPFYVLDDIDELIEVDIRDIEHGDIVLMDTVGEQVINHAGIYLNDEEHNAVILHQMVPRPSSYESYFRYQQYVVKVLRHNGVAK